MCRQSEIITEVANLFSNKVSLDKPDWIILIEDSWK